MHKRALSWYFTLNFTYFHTFSVNSQNSFSQLIFVWCECLFFVQTCYRTIVYFKKNIWNKNNKSCNLNSTFFLLDVKFADFSSGSGKLTISHIIAH